MREAFAIWFASILPRSVVYWCAMRVGANATMGPYSDQIVPDLTMMDALKRWNSK